ncbi:phospholipase D family protein [Bacillus sp. AFS040349]|uniref:phospholipase D family protein n=1 Tax=Bacillus sp. AFS040349 TaxID=2033502 RepID=UPI000BFBCD43|nr:phospholipase D family protein [Bacillus sp. AFS040349]PGT88757.1 NgoFVII family restriction endonuclease [Bacillus sp. AFS040349]
MPISFLDKNFGSAFFSLLDSTKKQIRLISPFIGYKTALALVNFIEQTEDELDCVLITRFDREDFIKGVSSIAGLECLKKAGVKMYALQGLHTKLYIFDSESVIMGSANFTFNGFYKNHEFGIFMEDEPEFSKECNNYFEGLLNDIKNDDDWEITLDRIAKEKPYCDDAVTGRAHSQKKPRKNESPVIIQPNQVKWGAKLDLNENSPSDIKDEKDILEEILKEEDEKQIRKRNTGIWLKFEGNSENRIPNQLTYFERRKKEHRKRTFFPKPPSGIKEGQLLFMTMVSTDKEDKGTPIIVGYAITSGFKENNVINDKISSNADRNRYPYYVELLSGKFLKAPIKNGITLRELARELQGNLYPNPKSNFSEIIYTHRQKSHLQITEIAHDFIMQQLDSLFSEHGYEEL